jgi:hypothetical protein
MAAKVFSNLEFCFLTSTEFHSKLFPPGLAEETLNTLALLFPSSDKKVEQWFQNVQKSRTETTKLDTEVIKCGHLRAEKMQIENFKFWHDRLIILKQVFDQSRPSTLAQWWFDRRNGVQWYVFPLVPIGIYAKCLQFQVHFLGSCLGAVLNNLLWLDSKH